MKIGVLTPIPSKLDVDLLNLILLQWNNLYERQKKHEMVFYFLAPKNTNAAKTITAFKANHKLVFFPEQCLELDSSARADVYQTRFVELTFYRNMLLNEAKSDSVDGTIFLDSDVVPPTNFVDCFVEDDKDICGGPVWVLNGAGEVVLGFGQYRKPFFSGLLWAQKLPNEQLTEMDFVNTACMYLSHKALSDENLRLSIFKTADGRIISEDHAFCHIAQSLGYKIFLDNRIKCAHYRPGCYAKRFPMG